MSRTTRNYACIVAILAMAFTLNAFTSCEETQAQVVPVPFPLPSPVFPPIIPKPVG